MLFNDDVILCVVHPTEPVELRCRRCNKLICLLRDGSAPEQNAADIVAKVLEQVFPEVRENLPEVREYQPEVRENQPEVREYQPEVRENQPEVRENQPEDRYNQSEVKAELRARAGTSLTGAAAATHKKSRVSKKQSKRRRRKLQRKFDRVVAVLNADFAELSEEISRLRATSLTSLSDGDVTDQAVLEPQCHIVNNCNASNIRQGMAALVEHARLVNALVKSRDADNQIKDSTEGTTVAVPEVKKPEVMNVDSPSGSLEGVVISIPEALDAESRPHSTTSMTSLTDDSN